MVVKELIESNAAAFHTHHMAHVQNEIEGTPEERAEMAKQALAGLDTWLDDFYRALADNVTQYRRALKLTIENEPAPTPGPFVIQLPAPPRWKHNSW